MIASIRPCDVPSASLLQAYGGDGGFADCYVTELAGQVSQAHFVEAFYTSPLFKIERTLLGWFARRPASDADARALAGGAETFSAWRVERRRPDELLLVDMTGRTRSWLRAVPDGLASTRLYFGSAVVPPTGHDGAASPGLGWAFHALLGFHRLYARALLRAATARIAARED